MLKHHFPVPRTSFLGAGCRWHRRISLAQVYPRVDLCVHMRCREGGVGDLTWRCTTSLMGGVGHNAETFCLTWQKETLLMFHHAQCASLASSGSKKKLVRVTNQIYLISLMCWIKNRLIKSKNCIVDGAFDPFFKWFKNHICQVSKKQLWKLIHIHDGSVNSPSKYYYLQDAQKNKIQPNNKKRSAHFHVHFLSMPHMKV